MLYLIGAQRDTKGMLAPGMELPGVLIRPITKLCRLTRQRLECSFDWNDRIGNVQYYLGFNHMTRVRKSQNTTMR